MNKHARKMMAPVAVVCGLLVYYGIGTYFLVTLDLPWPARAAAALGTLGLSGALIWVLRERIKEIKGGEEDDLGKY